MTIRVLIAEDHTLVSQGLEAMLSMTEDVEVIGIVTSAEDAVEQAGRADVVLMDVNLGKKKSGIDATREIKAKEGAPAVLVLTMFTDPSTVSDAIKAGAEGYLSKEADREKVASAIRDVAAGKSVLDPNVTAGIFGRIGGRDAHSLSDRELTVLQEIAHGNSTREVAQKIHVSEETVKTYLKQIFKKLNVKDRTEAVAEGFRRGLVH